MQNAGKPTQAVAFAKRALRRFSLDSLAMYALALVSELPAILLRTVLMFMVASFALAATGHFPGSERLTEIGLIPTLWSMLALATPVGTGWWWKQYMGGRRPSERERLAYHDAIELLQAHAGEPLSLPKNWFVLDTPTLDAAVCGDTLMLSRGLLESEHLPAVVAHELGHLAAPDGRLTAAINRLVLIPPRPRGPQQPGYEQTGQGQFGLPFRDPQIMLILLVAGLLRQFAKRTLKFANGGFGLRLTGPLWGGYWRAREYRADAYAASLGQADELADFLETHALIHDHPVPFVWLTEQTHPPSELRIDKLRNHALIGIADRPEPVKGTPSGPPSAGPDGLPLTEP